MCTEFLPVRNLSQLNASSHKNVEGTTRIGFYRWFDIYKNVVSKLLIFHHIPNEEYLLRGEFAIHQLWFEN
ncbi:hypothetical protein SAMN05428977_102617 [Nitrosomonas sp. Nm166]|nr:hypothetical protein SAMN05428977_102617 [Nitrosomonas sp. Nm166]